ncbi:MAG: hypothetical protein QOF15_4213, partial [Mycobacterium sp.]|nr:hypothetical protein [Mycobacterium sp.]
GSLFFRPKQPGPAMPAPWVPANNAGWGR